MKIIITKKGEGKTTKLLEMCKEHGYTIVTRNTHTVYALCEFLKPSDPKPITYLQFITGEYQNKDIKGFLIDDADQLLQMIVEGVEIEAITLTQD